MRAQEKKRVGLAVSVGAPESILPAHDDLQDSVQLRQSDVLPDLNAPPDGRMNILKRNPDLIYRSIFGHDLNLTTRQYATYGSAADFEAAGNLGFADTCTVVAASDSGQLAEGRSM